jgi:hypothetical protein
MSVYVSVYVCTVYVVCVLCVRACSVLACTPAGNNGARWATLGGVEGEGGEGQLQQQQGLGVVSLPQQAEAAQSC